MKLTANGGEEMNKTFFLNQEQNLSTSTMSMEFSSSHPIQFSTQASSSYWIQNGEAIHMIKYKRKLFHYSISSLNALEVNLTRFSLERPASIFKSVEHSLGMMLG